ncbi:acyl-CoA/acyl-ACP dehydrogenase [Sulfitobacter pseudonitzschiae]|jgi:alkylation response protein AidB-like acyl-CoA dehydrogenase|uniref:Acyl-CoA/acyl-ACP dehydrogenase n=2 Tax=Pseudosulfitobacter pseudonitzschiae TaxID=1402135 RepID=A0A9Q2RY37_9RHOB|nr:MULTISPECIES: acyl-CoA dehydrogenase family protein [Roseobacteraceae]MBM1816961.1 acyl-CoA/acyl-ACP dehydrogenase [Pseudosulfitobacter pseudonitzschiae]MBM1833974.1 acyl-CoA/acyl-ACP dehydrogenase [Pseudosulfitobacter pseudonitzschiae]MBM1838840.1 acyl-CoA/acyl-ACP dehydrogenase [Pseudosulfitobacter pseudonitzschiae]MBM1843689.1 acyl-CoA/acyl-ACP dehydrogenase [Pseudosulfitobacter pseudonitzschiae]MBM1848554.1 acyl-CoA/acyl-ACP dehydrogenase [Pseudosulfitobacter pseudonitzschiae]
MTLQERIAAPSAMLARVDAVATEQLTPLVREIDAGLYPQDVMHAFGTAGAFGSHVAPDTKMGDTIQAIARSGEECISTAFCMWCQNALAWYVASSDNAALKSTLLPKVASGQALGGTGLSNPMKTFFGIEKMRLKGRRVDGGYTVKGALPWVSNVGEDGYFGIVFSVEEEGKIKHVMAVARGDQPGVKTALDHDFMSMAGTATRTVQFRDALIEDLFVLADPIDGYLQKIRPGFVLMQTGMALGMIRSSIKLMEQVRRQLGHVNKYLEKQPEDFADLLDELEAEIMELAKTPYDTSIAYFRRVITARLRGGEASTEAAHFAMLHCGARGFVSQGTAQRRLRESYFIAVVTPATKQLRKMLADLPAA